MSGTITFKPVKAHTIYDSRPMGKEIVDPVCQFKIGFNRANSQPAFHESFHPHWYDNVSLKRKRSHEYATVKVVERGDLAEIGEAQIDLKEVTSQGKVQGWYPLKRKGSETGQIYLDMTYQPDKP